MKSDALFYELFQTAPQIFFELMQIDPPCPYRFESLTVKTTEKRIDGILEPEQEDEPIYFLEVQAFPDGAIYWRTLREVSTYFEQRPNNHDNEWQAVVLWLDGGDDPGLGTIPIYTENKAQRLISVSLPTLLQQLDERSLALNVLQPLTVDREAQVRENIFTWIENIKNTPDLEPDAEQRLITILSQIIEQKFKTLTYEELSKMLNLTPFRETTSFQEALREELQDDRTELLTKLIRRKFRFADSTMEKLTLRLQQLTLEDLEALFEAILDMRTLKQLNAWIDDRLPETNNA